MNRGVIILLLLVMLAGLVSASVRINEIELNPSGGDSGNEWIELYSDSEINLTGYSLRNADEDILELNISFNGYYVYTFDSGWLDNNDENVSLLDLNGTIVDNSPMFEDSGDDSKSWQYCSWNWTFRESNSGSANNCTIVSDSSGDSGEDKSLDLDLGWDDDEIINGKEFEITIETNDLEDEIYDLKIWIEDDDEDKISERYDEGEDKWGSGNNYVKDFIEGPGSEDEKIKLRIKETENDFGGDARIYARLRNDNGDIVITVDRKIEILEFEEEEIEEIEETAIKIGLTSGSEDEIIRLTTSNSSSTIGGIEEKDRTGNSIIYKSRNEYIKEYAVYGFAFLCVGIIILLLIDR
jgi:hypothetical protein